MPLLFADHGVKFRYPENWVLERQDTDSGWMVSVQSPDTAFLILSVDSQMPEVNHVAETALEALREEYPQLEAEECIDSVGGLPAVGHEIRFFSLDLTNTCWTRSFYTSNGTALLMCQMNDLESEINGQVLQAICASLEIEQD